MDDRLCADQRGHRHAVIGQIDLLERREILRRGTHIDIDHLIFMFQQFADRGGSGLAAATCHDDFFHPNRLLQ